jgi:Phosphotransferase enzyme family
MSEPPPPGRLPEARRNQLLRHVDWRYLLRWQERPRALDLSSGLTSEALRLIAEPAAAEPGGADLAVLDRLRRRDLEAARAALRPGGDLVCGWSPPLPGRPRRARRTLERAGFTDVRCYWPGPRPGAFPLFWLGLDSPAATAHLLAVRPPASRAQALLRPLWRIARRLGALGPLWVLARAPGADANEPGGGDELEALAPPGSAWLLLTGGQRSINKVVGLPFSAGATEPGTVVKFARIPEADAALAREAAVLRGLAAEQPGVRGVPRIEVDGRRGGRRALAQSAIHGRPLTATLSPATFPALAAGVTDWLVDLAAERPLRAAEDWRGRLVEQPLADLEAQFGAVLGSGGAERARAVLAGLGACPQVCEHRDCSPWNVVASADGPALLDWESAEPRGLPALDLVYFLATCAFRIEDSYGAGRTRQRYAELLDPASDIGRVAADCFAAYSAAVGLDPATLARLRLLCWIVHCRSDYRQLEMAAAGPPSAEALRGAIFLGLVEEELSRAGDLA